jgi:hypothetical protein
MKALLLCIAGTATGLAGLFAAAGSAYLTVMSIIKFWTLHPVLSWQYFCADMIWSFVAGVLFIVTAVCFENAKRGKALS